MPILQCVTVHRVPKFTSCHNAIMMVTGKAHCSILLCVCMYVCMYVYIYIYIKTLAMVGFLASLLYRTVS